MHRPPLGYFLGDGVGQLDLAARALFLAVQDRQDAWRQYVAPDDRQIGWRIAHIRFLNHPSYGRNAVLLTFDIEDTVGRSSFLWNLHSCNQRTACLLVGVNHLTQAGRFRGDDIVGQNDRKRLVGDQAAGAPYGVAQSHGFVLADIRDGAGIHVCGLQCLQQPGLAGFSQRRFKLGRVVEIIFQRGLSARCNEDKFLDSGGPRFVDRVLDQRAVDQRHDLLGNGFCGGQKSRAQSGNGKDCLGYSSFQFLHLNLSRVFEPKTAFRLIIINLNAGSKCNCPSRSLHRFKFGLSPFAFQHV